MAGGALARLRNLTTGLDRFSRQPAIRRALPSIILVGATAVAVLAWMLLRDPPRSTLYPGLAEAEKAGAPLVKYGAFINTAIDFMIIAFAIFVAIKAMNRLKRAEPPAPPPEPAPEPEDVKLLREIRDALKAR